MEVGTLTNIQVNGYTDIFTFIGGGATVLCYALPDALSIVYLFVADLEFNDGLQDEDRAKDVMVSAFKKGNGNIYLPKIKYINKTYAYGKELNKLCKIYKMPFYEDVQKSDKQAWVDMKVLHKLRADG